MDTKEPQDGALALHVRNSLSSRGKNEPKGSVIFFSVTSLHGSVDQWKQNRGESKEGKGKRLEEGGRQSFMRKTLVCTSSRSSRQKGGPLFLPTRFFDPFIQKRRNCVCRVEISQTDKEHLKQMGGKKSLCSTDFNMTKKRFKNHSISTRPGKSAQWPRPKQQQSQMQCKAHKTENPATMRTVFVSQSNDK